MLNRNRKLLYLVTCAMMIALGVVLKLYSIPLSPTAKVGFGPVPAMTSGILFGPLAGFIVGALSDVIGFLVQGNGSFNPATTLMYALSGVVPALFVSDFRLLRAKGDDRETLHYTRAVNNRALQTYWRLQLGVLVSQIINSLLLNTFGLAILTYSSQEGLTLGQHYLALLTVRWPMSIIMAFVYPVLVFAVLTAYRAAFRSLPETSVRLKG